LKGNFHSISTIKKEQLIENYEVSLEPICNRLQQYSQVFHYPIAGLLDDIYSQSFSPLAGNELQNRGDKNVIGQLASLSGSVGVSVQISSENLQSYQESKDNDESSHSGYEDCLEQSSNILDALEINMYSYEDPFETFFRSAGGLILCNFIDIQSVYKFLWEFPLNSSLFLLIRKHLRRI